MIVYGHYRQLYGRSKRDRAATNGLDIAGFIRALQAFKQYCTMIFAGPLSENTTEDQVTFILIWAGQGLKMFTSWDVSSADRMDPKKIWDHFEKHIAPKSNVRLNKFQLHTLRHNPTETIEEFMTRCKLQAHKCKFRDQEQDDRLIEQLIIGTRHKKSSKYYREKMTN
jgi:hypothetical protein